MTILENHNRMVGPATPSFSIIVETENLATTLGRVVRTHIMIERALTELVGKSLANPAPAAAASCPAASAPYPGQSALIACTPRVRSSLASVSARFGNNSTCATSPSGP